MDIKLFTEILRDKHFTDYRKMKYKYGANFTSLLEVLADLYYHTLPLADFDGKPVVIYLC